MLTFLALKGGCVAQTKALLFEKNSLHIILQ
jgi:hypothetical protein